MKLSILLVFVLLTGAKYSTSQNQHVEPRVLVNLGGYSPFYFMNYLGFRNQSNIGAEISTGLEFKKFWFETGVQFQTKRYYQSIDDTTSINKHLRHVSYINFPLQFNFRLGNMPVSIQSGIRLHQIVGINFIDQYDDDSKKSYYPTAQRKLGLSANLGLDYEKRLNQKLSFYVNSFVDFKFISDFYAVSPKDEDINLTSDPFQLIFSLGIRYHFSSPLKKE